MIPKIIHQTYKTADLPWFFKKGQDSVKEHFKDWEYRFWTDEDLDRFVQEHYPRFYQQWLALDRHIKRVDTARYMLLHHFGGVYADLDLVFKKPIDEILNEDVGLFFYRSTQALVKNWSFLGNAWLASEPNQDFWIELLEWIFLQKKTDADPAHHTGPWAIGTFYNRLYFVGKCPPMTIFGPDIFDNEKCFDGVGKAEYGTHGRYGTWHIRNKNP